jgi:phosphoglycerate dehydrogenase-like enzyme
MAEALADVAFLVPAHDRRDVVRVLGELPELRVVQVLSAGTDWVEDAVPDGVTLCNARGARDVTVAEWIVGAMLADAHRQFDAARAQVAHDWIHLDPVELAGSRVLILGMGSIGEATRSRLEALGCTVTGIGRARVGELPDLLPETDAVVVLTPLTDETRGMVGSDFLARMRDGATLVNAGRGAVVDTGALLAELQAGRLRAVLDVVDPEPLPPDHPLWEAPGTFIAPHRAGNSPQAEERAWRLAGEQLARFARGEPLLNVVS